MIGYEGVVRAGGGGGVYDSESALRGFFLLSRFRTSLRNKRWRTVEYYDAAERELHIADIGGRLVRGEFALPWLPGYDVPRASAVPCTSSRCR